MPVFEKVIVLHLRDDHRESEAIWEDWEIKCSRCNCSFESYEEMNYDKHECNCCYPIPRYCKTCINYKEELYKNRLKTLEEK